MTSMSERTKQLADEAATIALGQALANATQTHWQTHPSKPIHAHLMGGLGAGKSTLARAWLRTLGVQGTIRSPTYTLVEQYEVQSAGSAIRLLAHLDLYRLHDADELTFMDFDDLCAASSLLLVEWPQRAMDALPEPMLRIELTQSGAGRQVKLAAPMSWDASWGE